MGKGAVKMRIAVLGTRGFPDVQGGVEAHCQNLYPALVKLGCEVIVFGRKPYLKNNAFEYLGVKIIPLPCPKSKFFESIAHTLFGVFACLWFKPDIVHIHAIGPGLYVPLVRILGMRVVVTHHGPDYQRQKWNGFARVVLRIGEVLSARFANEMIAISAAIAEDIKNKFSRKVVVIPNGVAIPEIKEEAAKSYLEKLGLEKRKYFLAVARFVPEKGLDILVEAFCRFHDSGLCQDWKLVIVGDANHEDAYSRRLKERIKVEVTKGCKIVLTGILSQEQLRGLYQNAGIFVLPSYYEGLPIVLLEAMSFGLSCLASDIPANRELGLADEHYFKAGDSDELFKKLCEFVQKPLDEIKRKAQINFVAERYNWDKIAKLTLDTYFSIFTKI